MTTEYKNDATPRFDLDDSLEEGKGEESDDEDEVLGDYEDIDGNCHIHNPLRYLIYAHMSYMIYIHYTVTLDLPDPSGEIKIARWIEIHG